MSIVFHHVIFRALLRWGAALAFCLPLKHRPGFRLRTLGMLLPLIGLTYVLDPAAQSTSLHELQFSLLLSSAAWNMKRMPMKKALVSWRGPMWYSPL